SPPLQPHHPGAARLAQMPYRPRTETLGPIAFDPPGRPLRRLGSARAPAPGFSAPACTHPELVAAADVNGVHDLLRYAGIARPRTTNGTDLNDPLRMAPALAAPPPVLRLKALAAATALALGVLPNARSSQTIGALDVRSRLGEPFFAAAAITLPDGIIDPGCIRVTPNPNAPAGAESLQSARIRVGSADTVIIETPGAVSGPVVGLRLEVGCGQPVS